MDLAVEMELKAHARQDAMNSVIDRFESPVQQFYSGATVLVTGGSGFLGKQLVEKLFRSTKLNKVCILMRTKKGKTAGQRLNEVLEDPVFDGLHKEQASFVDRIATIEGDVTQIGLGLNEDDRNTIIQEVNMIFHVAATIRFDEPLKTAIITNIRGTREILNLARECKKLRSFIHVSTAYTHSTLANLGEQVLEQFYPCPVPPDVMIQLVEGVNEEILNMITPGLTKGWPNTYSFTKVLAEELIRTTAGDLPICIIRPTIVICTNCEPVPGWVDRSGIIGASGLTLGITMGVIHTLQSRNDVILDFIPMDYVNNACIAAAWETDRRRQAGERDIKIYVLSSSARNPTTEGQLLSILIKDVATTVVSPQPIWYCFIIQSTNKWVFLVLDFVLHEIPGTIMDTILMVLRKPPRVRKMFAMLRMMPAIMKFYLTNEWIFDDKNTLALYNSLSANDQKIYNFDVCNMDWLEHVRIWCIGLRKYVIKDGLKDSDIRRKKQFYFKIINYIIFGLLLCVISFVMFYLFT